jgi:uncharacterized protein (TIGR03086 family)
MPEIAERYRKTAGQFTTIAAAVPEDAWDNPAPCEGWVARDVVGHMVEWMPAFLRGGAGIELPAGPPVDDDPAAAWTVMSDGIQALLDDPESAARTFEHERAGRHSLEDAVGMFFLGDVLVHTWDLARATGLDEALDADEVRTMLAGIRPLGDALSASGQYGAPVDVDDAADEQTKLIAFTGRQP